MYQRKGCAPAVPWITSNLADSFRSPLDGGYLLRPRCDGAIEDGPLGRFEISSKSPMHWPKPIATVKAAIRDWPMTAGPAGRRCSNGMRVVLGPFLGAKTAICLAALLRINRGPTISELSKRSTIIVISRP
jgi:hypothetical protein